jgi:hypothetical protein
LRRRPSWRVSWRIMFSLNWFIMKFCLL